MTLESGIPIFFVSLSANIMDMRKHIFIIIHILAAILLIGCDYTNKTTDTEIIVSIEPLKYVVGRIVGNDFTIGVLVPTNSSPETYEPTPRQRIAIDNAKMVFATGLMAFEQRVVEKMARPEQISNLSNDIELIAGECSHCNQGHAHGVDPHIWTSPEELRIMARNAYNAIMQHYPDSVKYTAAYQLLDAELEQLSTWCRDKIESSVTQAFVIYHPALTYYARSYNIEQIAIENEGKEPSAKRMAEIIELSRKKGVDCLLYQVEFPRSMVEVIANDMNIEPIEINPLDANPIEFIKDVTLIITGNRNDR